MPRGDPNGGRWTRVGRGAEEDTFVQGGEPADILLGGDGGDVLNRHIIQDHIAKTDAEPAARIQREQVRGLLVWSGRDRNGTFASAESARDLIRRTIEYNAAAVDLVARGEKPRAFLTWRFGYVTGREAYSIPPGAPIRFRPTYMVGVEIKHHPKSPLGYRIVSAYPRNHNERIGR